MPEFLQQSFGSDLNVSIWILSLRLVGAFAMGCAVAGIYRLTRRGSATAATFPATLVLLAILIALVTQVIGDHIARAFSLVGALSIVRFRTVVEDTHDIAFVIFSVVIGMAVGANQLLLALLGLVVVGIAAFVVRPRPPSPRWADRDCVLSVRVGVGRSPDTVLLGAFEKSFDRFELTSGVTSRQGAALDLTYKVRLRHDCEPIHLLDELNRLEGIQGVELRRD